MIDLEEIADIMGWDRKIIKILTTIIRTKDCTVGNLSSLTKLDRGMCYRAIDMLKKHGIVKTSLSNPTILSIADGNEVIHGMDLKMNDEVIQKTDAIIALMKELEDMRILRNTTTMSEFTVISGIQNIWAAFSKKIKIAENTIIFLVSGIEFNKMKYSTIYDSLEKSAADITIITDEGKYEIPKSDRIHVVVNNEKIRGRIMIIDDNYLIFSGNDMRSYKDETDTCVVTNDLGIIDHYRKVLKPYVLEVKTVLPKEKNTKRDNV